MLSFALRCILLRALNFQSGARSCLNPSDALPASSPGVASRLRERFWGVCGSCGLGGTWPWVGSPLHRTRSCPAARPPRKAPNSHPDHRDLAVRLRVLLWPCSIFFFFYRASLQNAHPPSPPPFVSFLLQLQRSLGPGLYGLCHFQLSPRGNVPSGAVPVLRGARRR